MPCGPDRFVIFCSPTSTCPTGGCTSPTPIAPSTRSPPPRSPTTSPTGANAGPAPATRTCSYPRSAPTTTPFSPLCPATRFQNLPTTPGQLRQDRILEEALATGADPLHLTAMFGFTAETALRYARV